MMDAGTSAADVMRGIHELGQQRNRDAQKNVPAPPTMPDDHWQQRRSYLQDGEPLYGSHGSGMGAYDEYGWAAEDALNAGDQEGFSRARDLLFKAWRTQAEPDKRTRPAPPPPDEPEAEPEQPPK